MNLTFDRRAWPIATAIFAMVAAGCTQSGPEAANATPNPPAPSTGVASMGPATPPPASDAPAAPAGDVTAVPNTTTIDGKQVKLEKTASGLRYYDTKVGSGPTPKDGQAVTVSYFGTFLDGTKFDSNDSFTFNLGGQVIQGWNEGVATMKVGGKRRLVVPGDLAYGPSGRGPIPPNATLVFDIELLGIQ